MPSMVQTYSEMESRTSVWTPNCTALTKNSPTSKCSQAAWADPCLGIGQLRDPEPPMPLCLWLAQCQQLLPAAHKPPSRWSGQPCAGCPCRFHPLLPGHELQCLGHRSPCSSGGAGQLEVMMLKYPQEEQSLLLRPHRGAGAFI